MRCCEWPIGPAHDVEERPIPAPTLFVGDETQHLETGSVEASPAPPPGLEQPVLDPDGSEASDVEEQLDEGDYK